MPTITSEGLVWDAIYLALRNDAGCIAVFPYSDGKAAVFDENNVPVGLNPPYIVLGESVSTPANVFGKKGQDVVATIHGWSEYQGKTEILKMHDAIFNVLDDGQSGPPTLTLLGGVFRSIACLYDNGQILPDNTSNINKWHMTDRYRVLTEAI
ncbi:MAG TPA: DUF3168 domain-containing protein [Patescibacteria group bacterium]